jgi:hypothetical protein
VSVQALQHHPKYAMTLQARKDNHTRLDHNAGRTADLIAGRTAVHDPSVSAGSVRNAECRMDNFVPIVVLWHLLIQFKSFKLRC